MAGSCIVFRLNYNSGMETQLSIRIPDALHKRLMALVQDPPLSLAARGSMKRSAVMREALARGIEAMEREAKQQREAS